MARYPTFEEYEQRGNYKDGIKRCDDLLKKNPNDVQLWTVKLQLLSATKGDVGPALDQLLSIQPPIQDLREIVTIEEAVVSSQSDDFRQPKTTGAAAARLWENAFKASNSLNYKLDLQSLRFSRAIINNRLADAQQSLIQLKALQPKNRVTYMAHVAVTQLLSTSKEDLQSRLSLSLARKAVTERFDDDKSLDCRVPGQIFALQGSSTDLESITDRPFKESKQVYDALRDGTRSSVNGISTTQGTKDPASVPAAEWLLSEVQMLKQQFAQLIELSAPSETILSFVINAVRLFRTAAMSLTEDRRRVKADACFLSISALVRLFELTHEPHYLLQAALFAEILLQHDSHIHEARVILVYLYMRLGLGSLALRLFHSLNVKEVQHDTVGHALFTRLSITHPFSTTVTRKTSIDPLERTSHASKVYTRCEEKLAENEASVLSHGQTGMIFDLQELRDSLRSSVTRRIVHLEQRRIGRLVGMTDGKGGDASQIGPKMTANWLEVTDNRDFAATFDYGYNVEKVLHGFGGGLPGKDWILYALAADLAWCLAMGSPTSINDTEKLIAELSKVGLDIDSLQLDGHGTSLLGMTHAEYLTGNLACQVLRMLVNVTTSPAQLSDDISNVRKSVTRLNISALVESTDTFTERLVDHYAYCDVLRILLKACEFLSKQTTECSDELRDLTTLVKDLYGLMIGHAQDQMKKIDVTDIKKLLAQHESIWDAITLFGADDFSSYCQSVTKSAKEGWEGLTKIKLS